MMNILELSKIGFHLLLQIRFCNLEEKTLKKIIRNHWIEIANINALNLHPCQKIG